MNMNDGNAFYLLGGKYHRGIGGLPYNHEKAMELWNKAAELGTCNAHAKIASFENCHVELKKDREKARYHYQIAAMGGHEIARHILGIMELDKGNLSLAMKHWMISARAGFDESLKNVGGGYKRGHVTKDEYATTLRAYQSIRDEMKSDERAKATIMNELMQQLG